MRLPVRTSLIIFVGALLAQSVSAVTLDWDGHIWTAGSLTNSYDVDPLKAGNDITLTVSGDTAQLQPKNVAPNPMTPALTTDLQGGLSVAENSLNLAVNFANQSQFLTITVNFSATYTAGVNNVSFTIFDVDFSNASTTNSFQDQLQNIRALSIDGVTLIAPTITVGSANTLTGSGLAQIVTGSATNTDTGATSGNGNVTISFGAAAIKSFTFVYGSGSGPQADPTYQHIGIHDISFTPVPEVNPGWSALVSCVVAAGLVLRQRSVFRKK